jgi:hypothetical protein
VRNTAGDRPGRLIRNQPLRHDRAGPGNAFRHALAAGDLARLFAHLVLVDGDVAGHRPAFADPLVAGDRAFFPNRARHPAPNGPGPLAAGIAARIAAGIAAIAAAAMAMVFVMEEPANTFPEARPAGNFTALVVAAIDAAANRGRNRLTGDERLHHRALFAGGDADANLADHRASFGNHLVDGAGVGPRFRDTLAPVRRAGDLLALGVVDRARTLIVFGYPLVYANGAVLGTVGGRSGARGRLGIVVFICPRGLDRADQKTASQQCNANMLPDHGLSFVPHLPILAGTGTFPLGRTGQPTRLNVIQLCLTWGSWRREIDWETEEKALGLVRLLRGKQLQRITRTGSRVREPVTIPKARNLTSGSKVSSLSA